MDDFKFNVGGTGFTIQNLGDSLNQAFINLHRHLLLKEPFDYTQFNRAAHSYFARHVGDWPGHDAFFNNFTIIWRWLLELGHHTAAERVWDLALASASSWEDAHSSQRLHKGTPYYFRGMTVVLRGDLDRGFLLMHQAYDEDIRSKGTRDPDTPASAFVTLDYRKQDQAFRVIVEDTATFLDQLLVTYRQTRAKTLTLDDFRDRLFNVTDLRDPLFLLVFSLFKLKALLRGMKPILRTNEFAGLLEVGLLFDLCLVIDSVIGYRNQQSWRFIDRAASLSSAAQLSLSRDELAQLNRAFGQGFKNFPNVVDDVLRGTFLLPDGRALGAAETDVALAYGFRNLGAHRIEGLQTIYDEFEDISQRIMNVLFLAVEHLYI